MIDIPAPVGFASLPSFARRFNLTVGVPPAELRCLADDAADASLAKVKELGGKIIDGPDDSPFGRIATIADPSGAQLQLCAISEAEPNA